MISTGLLASHPDHHELADELAARRRAMADRFAQYLEHWLPPADAGDMAVFLCTVLQGLAVHARDETGVGKLSAVAAIACAGVLCSVKSCR
ncbi:hypothetical protein C5748_13495 [Phyllobacterium phragmitis]|uniref:TetR family transcriptional regulator n=2 Tax=Phyllobacterium phragmitis TaxID=2670329 RepID=A0A2S9IRP3_9HYPH|nr:hypothetical protein C5748_13495 [Phyllobacterium phragmitis]